MLHTLSGLALSTIYVLIISVKIIVYFDQHNHMCLAFSNKIWFEDRIYRVDRDQFKMPLKLCILAPCTTVPGNLCICQLAKIILVGFQ